MLKKHTFQLHLQKIYEKYHKLTFMLNISCTILKTITISSYHSSFCTSYLDSELITFQVVTIVQLRNEA